MISLPHGSRYVVEKNHTPVEPNPPSPRSVEDRTSTLQKDACSTGDTTICAILSPFLTVKGLSSGDYRSLTPKEVNQLYDLSMNKK